MAKEEMNEQGMTNEEILMNEDELIAGLLQAADFQQTEEYLKRVEIKRGGKILFSFRVHPLSEEQTQEIRRRCTRYAPDPRGQRYGRVEIETDIVKLRSTKIYEATALEDQKLLWNNKKVMDKLNCVDPVDVIDQVLMAGEKDAVVEVIDGISGFGSSVEAHAKN